MQQHVFWGAGGDHQAAGVAATFLNSTLSPAEARSRLAGLHEKRGASVWPVNLIDLSHGKAWSLVLDAALAVVTARKVLRDLRAGG